VSKQFFYLKGLLIFMVFNTKILGITA